MLIRIVLALAIALSGLPRPAAAIEERPEGPASALDALVLGQGYGGEVEPNNDAATATPLAGTNVVVRANLPSSLDVDFFSFSANAGDRVYAATMHSASASLGGDSFLEVVASNGTTVLEADNSNGSFPAGASSIAGTLIPASGTYYLRVTEFVGTALRPYELHFRLQSGTPAAEVEPNNTFAAATPLPASGWASGARSAAADVDIYSFQLGAGDTAFLSLDLDPERDGVSWDGRLGIGLFGDAGNQVLTLDDPGGGETPNLPSEASFFTAKTAGTYYAIVDAAGASAGPSTTYRLSVSVHPHVDEGTNCTTYTSTDVPKTIPNTAPPILVSSVLTVPGNPRIADVDVTITLDHTFMQDLDLHLRTPAGNDIGLATDIGGASAAQAQMDVTFDDEAATPPTFGVTRSFRLKPEANYRLSWLDGESAGGTWTLDVRDDAEDDGGALTGWSIRVCEPPPPPACAPGFVQETVFSTDFESGDAGFTHSGAQDEWELGLPATLATSGANPLAAFTTCNSGTTCWKTDLDNSYNFFSHQDLLSPPLDLTGLAAPIVVRWAQRYQIDSANFENLSVDARQVGGATPVRLFEWLDARMADSVGLPAVNIGASSGWSTLERRADGLAGTVSEVKFRLDSDGGQGNFSGYAVDDVSVTACRQVGADLSVTKTNGVTSVGTGEFTHYDVVVTNPAGDDPVPTATVSDAFPAGLNCYEWACTPTNGATCAGGINTGPINDTVSLPAGSTLTYGINCFVTAAAAGTLSNTAGVTAGVFDPDPSNNSATDTDVVTLVSDLSIVVDDGVTTVRAGEAVTYSIDAFNGGASDTLATVTDVFPAALTGCTWTCAAANGAACTPSGSGSIVQNVSLPAGGSVRYSAACQLPANTPEGVLANTATVSSPNGDPTPDDHASTDVDTIVRSADVAVSKTVDVATPTVGSNVTYTVTARNHGPSTATVVRVTDRLPDGLTFVSATPSAGTYSQANGLWTIGTLPVGASATLALVATVTNGQALVNQAAVTFQLEQDGDRSNNSGTAAINAPGLADVQVAASVDDTQPDGGDVNFEVRVHNAGPTGATGLRITDDLPSGLTHVAASASQGTYSPVTGAWDVGALANGATATLQITSTVDSGPSPITRVFAKTAHNEPDYATDNDSDSVSLNNPTVADLAVSFVASQEPVAAGETFSYTAVVANHGPGEATNTLAFVELAAGLELVSATATQGFCLGTTQLTCPIGTLADGASASIRFVVTKTVGGPVASGITVLSSEFDPYQSNNSNDEATTPAALTGFRVE